MFTEIRESLQHIYLEDARLWLVGFNGGNVNSYDDAPHDVTRRFDFLEFHTERMHDWIFACSMLNI